jgi:hypothetical protein
MKMNKFKSFALAIALPLISIPAAAQEDFNQFLQNDIEESKILLGEYISPFMKSVSLGLNQGWYNTAKNHKLLGVDLTVTVSAMTIPDDQTLINIKGLGLQSFDVASDNAYGDFSPTVFGPKGSSSLIYKRRDSQGNVIAEEPFEGPEGLGMKDEIGKNFMPVPIAHLGIGLPKNTELKIRFVPSIDLNGKGDFNMWGLGVMHDVKQWIPGIKLLPLDLAGFVGFTKMDLVYRPDPSEDVAGEDQRSELSLSATTIQVLVSKKFSVLTLYGGVGYNIAKSKLALKGTYDINDDGDTDDASEVNPFDFSYSASGPRATAGFRLKLAVLTLHADYSFQKYKALSVGVGISVR